MLLFLMIGGCCSVFVAKCGSVRAFNFGADQHSFCSYGGRLTLVLNMACSDTSFFLSDA
jgi:hypothetical protein